MANPNTLSMPKQAAKAAPEVTPEVAPAPRFVTTTDAAAVADADAAFNAARAARFVITTGDAPVSNGPTSGKLNAKTLAEHAAGKQALAQYAPASE
jgi:hypothetical protein